MAFVTSEIARLCVWVLDSCSASVIASVAEALLLRDQSIIAIARALARRKRGRVQKLAQRQPLREPRLAERQQRPGREPLEPAHGAQRRRQIDRLRALQRLRAVALCHRIQHQPPVEHPLGRIDARARQQIIRRLGIKPLRLLGEERRRKDGLRRKVGRPPARAPSQRRARASAAAPDAAQDRQRLIGERSTATPVGIVTASAATTPNRASAQLGLPAISTSRAAVANTRDAARSKTLATTIACSACAAAADTPSSAPTGRRSASSAVDDPCSERTWPVIPKVWARASTTPPPAQGSSLI